ncbi:putative glycolipid-binding domain-containing protein [uncultured Leifsonia sp.]|uniref:putative glycolipid-binding domain-containing protein n=1 Tax=uncultured Leifsonia sp. TaxID=340359 RepID=UPI0025CD3B92|nr:putative glycolipid-binding domain-containing protein [uncultured Leifsonia sp.]
MSRSSSRAASYAWKGLDDPDRIDHAVVKFEKESMTAHGTSITSAYASSWRLTVADGWVTRSLSVSVHGTGWTRSLELGRSANGDWSAHATEDGTPIDVRRLGFAPDAFADAIDCDLGLCPVTNTMPIRRLGLLDGNTPPRALPVVWVDVPTLRVSLSTQMYSSGEGLVRYEVPSGEFTAGLTVDPDGVVVHYPELAERFSC